MSGNYWGTVIAIILAVWLLGLCAGCVTQDELKPFSPARQACERERDRIRMEIWEERRNYPGRIEIYRPIPRCGHIR